MIAPERQPILKSIDGMLGFWEMSFAVAIGVIIAGVVLFVAYGVLTVVSEGW